MTQTPNDVRETVRRKYAEIAKSADRCCAEPACCGETEARVAGAMIGDAYDGVSGYVAEADLGLGCGLPVEHAALQPGQTVLDLGSGAGLDAFIARRLVGTQGRVIGVDMTAEMIARARENAAQQGFDNVEFRLGEIEHLPVRSNSIDVAISNCVLNLVPDKQRAFTEIFRVLKPGGRMCISDVVSSATLPGWVQGIAEAYAGCVAGALPRSRYLQMLRDAGFKGIEVVSERRIVVPESLLARALTTDQREAASRDDLHVLSVTVTAARP
jgi:ubiquinone/menaquinone biosynthesis C-methylase UbiE